MNCHLASGVNLFYTVSGSGPALILIHGNAETHAIFTPLIDHLVKDFTVYAIDSRGHGQSSPDDGYFDYDDLADDIAGFVATLGITSAGIIGFSDGGIIALLLAARQLSWLTRVVSLSPNLSPADWKREERQWANKRFRKNPNQLNYLMLYEPQIPLSQLATITIPVWVIAGENDIFRPETFPRIAEAIPRGRLTILPGQTHSSYIVDSDDLAELALSAYFTASD